MAMCQVIAVSIQHRDSPLDSPIPRAAYSHINRIQRLACGHEQAVAACAAEADVGADFGQADDADGIAVGGDDLHAGPGAGPDVAVDVAAHAVGRGAIARGRVDEFGEYAAVAQVFAIDVPHTDVPAGAGVGDIEQAVVGRETQAVGRVDVIGYTINAA